jgi:hypothetical protein
MRILVCLAAAVLAVLPFGAAPAQPAGTAAATTYADLVALHGALRAYMVPPVTGAVVLESGARVGDDYSDRRMDDQLRGLADFEARLVAMPVASWPRGQQVEWLAVRSLLNGYRFNLVVLQPWARDPGFYLDPLMRVAFTDLPAAGQDGERLRARLEAIPPMLVAARGNLDAMATDFADLALFNLENSDGVNHYHPWRAVPPAGIIGWYDDLLGRARAGQPDLVPAIAAARAALVDFRDWLAAERPRIDAPAGVGPARLQYYLTHVRMIPWTVEEMRVMARREHERLSAALALTRHRDRARPEIALSRSAEAQQARVAATDRALREFLVREQIVTIPDYVGELGSNTPWIERPGGPNFWEQIQFRDPIPDHLHAVVPGHRFDAEIAERDTRPIRAPYSDGARVEGWATYLEEALMLAGAVADPRAESFIQLFGIFRAARVPADINMQHNVWSAAEAVAEMRRITPWLDEDVARVDAEIYLRRPPGYGLAYTIGKLQMDALLAEQSRRLGPDFVLRDFHDAFLAAGRLPIALVRYEMTGEADQVANFWETPSIPD